MFIKKLVEWDIWINVHVFKGNEGETISSRLGRYIEDKSKPVRGWMARIFCRIFLLPLSAVLVRLGLQKHPFKHCRESIQDEFKSK